MSLQPEWSTDESPVARRRDLAAVLFALVLPTIVTWLYFYHAERWPSAVQGAVFGTVKVLQFAFPAAWVVFVLRRRLRPGWSGTSGVGLGLAFGGAVAAAMVGLYLGWLRQAPEFSEAAEAMRAKVAGLGLDSAAKYVAIGVFYSVCHSLLEEYYWRWFVFGQLERFVPVNAAIAISSLGFMSHHVLVVGKYFGFTNWLTWFLSLSVAVGGAAWAWLYRRSGSLWGPWASHLAVDAAIFSLGYAIVCDLWQG